MKASRHITVLVSNDLQFDQRVNKICNTLRSEGAAITRVGRLLRESKGFDSPDEIRRFRLPFHRGALFYASLNIRLFFYLLFKKTDVIWANDLDTLLPAFLVSRLRKKALVYDSHEYFTEAEGLTGRAFQKKTWERIEAYIFPRLKHVITVNESIADIYRKKYSVDVHVVRNIASLLPPSAVQSPFVWPEGKHRIILQGAYIDPDRGGMEAAESMQYLPNAHLLIVGAGRDIPNIKKRVDDLKLNDRVSFLGRQDFDTLRAITATADIGLSLDKPLHLNYTLSLPNKIFDYIHAGVPVVVSDLPELRRIVSTWKVGSIVADLTPEGIAAGIKDMLGSQSIAEYKHACLRAREALNWQNEEGVIKAIMASI